MNNEISAVEPDWSRERPRRFWDPSRKLLASIRCYQKHKGRRNPVSLLLRKLAVWRHRFWSVVTGADISINARIGGGLLMYHPNGIVIHQDAIIGPNCLIFQQVTIGLSKAGSKAGAGAPVIGGHVDIGAGAKIIGKINIGDHVCIGANAVVLSDIQSYSTAVGIPARVVT